MVEPLTDPEAITRAEVNLRKQIAGCVRRAKEEMDLSDDSVRTVMIISLMDIDMRIKYNIPLVGDMLRIEATPG